MCKFSNINVKKITASNLIRKLKLGGYYNNNSDTKSVNKGEGTR